MLLKEDVAKIESVYTFSGPIEIIPAGTRFHINTDLLELMSFDTFVKTGEVVVAQLYSLGTNPAVYKLYLKKQYSFVIEVNQNLVIYANNLSGRKILP